MTEPRSRRVNRPHLTPGPKPRYGEKMPTHAIAMPPAFWDYVRRQDNSSWGAYIQRLVQQDMDRNGKGDK